MLLALNWLAVAQDFRITEAQLDATGRVVIRHPGGASFYFTLLRGETVLTITNAAGIRLGQAEDGQFTDTGHAGRQQSFYRIIRRTLTLPVDADGDGIDDVWELQRPGQLNALAATDAQQPSAGPGSPAWIDVYRGSQASTARFASGSTEVLANAGNVPITVLFSKAYTGPVRFLVSGTASPGRDYDIAGLNSATRTAQVQASGTEVSIPITLIDRPAIDRDRTVLLTLLEPQAANGYRLATDASMTHSLVLREATQGVFAGTMTFTNGVALPAQSLKLALRTGAGGLGEARVDALASTFFRANFTLPVRMESSSGVLAFPQSVSRVIEINSLGRPLAWTLTISSGLMTNNVLTAPVRLTLRGLTATDYEVEALGSLLLTRLNPEE